MARHHDEADSGRGEGPARRRDRRPGGARPTRLDRQRPPTSTWCVTCGKTSSSSGWTPELHDEEGSAWKCAGLQGRSTVGPSPMSRRRAIRGSRREEELRADLVAPRPARHGRASHRLRAACAARRDRALHPRARGHVRRRQPSSPARSTGRDPAQPARRQPARIVSIDRPPAALALPPPESPRRSITGPRSRGCAGWAWDADDVGRTTRPSSPPTRCAFQGPRRSPFVIGRRDHYFRPATRSELIDESTNEPAFEAVVDARIPASRSKPGTRRFIRDDLDGAPRQTTSSTGESGRRRRRRPRRRSRARPA